MNVPGLSGWIAAQNQAQQESQNNLKTFGFLQDFAAKNQAQQREMSYRRDLAALGPNPTQEQIIGVTAKYASPDKLMDVQQKSLDRKSAVEQRAYETAVRIEAQKDMARQKFEADLALARERGANAEQLRQMQIEADERIKRMEIQGREFITRLTASMRPEPNPHLVAVEGADGKPVYMPAAQAAGKKPYKEPVARALPAPLQKQLTESAELADATERFVKTFKPDYGGKTIMGDASNTFGRMFGDDSGQAQWWQDYELHQSQVRNKLFGSALTAPEIAAWNKSAINPRMNSGEIQKNLARRAELEKRGLDRLTRGAAAGGYNREQIEAFTGRPMPTSQPSQPQQTQRIRFDAQGNPIQ